MIKLTSRVLNPVETADTLVMDYQDRTRGRIKVESATGREFGIFLERGQPLKCGEFLGSDDGLVVKIEAKPESLVRGYTDDWLTFSRCCYHLGNRHVPLEVGNRELFMQEDKVLEDMLIGLGMQVEHVSRGFHPEQGAYHHAH